MLKKCKVVVLPTNEKAKIGIGKTPNGLLNYLKLLPNTKAIINDLQHVYIVSDEEIKEGNWYLWLNNKQISEASKNIVDTDLQILNRHLKSSHIAKIIATTDKSLKYSVEQFDGVHSWNLPAPSQLFIEKYIQKYNQGNPITDIMVEYEPKRWIKNPNISKEQDILDTDNIKTLEDYDKYLDYNIKINPKDNTIIIKPIKDSWNREEVIKLLSNLQDNLSDNQYFHNKYRSLDKWIEENL